MSPHCRRSRSDCSTGCSIPNTSQTPGVPGPQRPQGRSGNGRPNGSRHRARSHRADISRRSRACRAEGYRHHPVEPLALGDRQILLEPGDMVEDRAPFLRWRRNPPEGGETSGKASAGRISGKYQPLFKASARTGQAKRDRHCESGNPDQRQQTFPRSPMNHAARAREARRPPSCLVPHRSANSNVPSVATTTAAQTDHIAAKKNSRPAAAQP